MTQDWRKSRWRIIPSCGYYLFWHVLLFILQSKQLFRSVTTDRKRLNGNPQKPTPSHPLSTDNNRKCCTRISCLTIITYFLVPEYEQNHLESPWNRSYISFLPLRRSEEPFIIDQRAALEWQVDSIRIKSRFRIEYYWNRRIFKISGGGYVG